MTVRVSREFTFHADPADVWAFISDPERRAGAISVVEGFEITGDHTARWTVGLPIPLVNSTIAVETEEIETNPPTHVKFTGKSSAFRVTGEHTIERMDGEQTRLHNEFVVDGRVPGVETFFKRNLDDEMDNLERALLADPSIDV